MKFTSIFVLVACAAATHAASVANVLADIAVLNTRIASANTLVQAFPATGGTLANALAIHNAFAAIVAPINTANADTASLTPLPLSVADATAILDAVDGFKANLLGKLDRIVVVKASFVALPVGGLPALLRADLNNLNNARNAFEASLVAKLPSSLVARGNAFHTSVSGGFTTAIAAYA